MNRLLSQVPRMPRWMPRWRHLRWVACAAVVPALWACNSRRLATPTPVPAVIDARTFKQTVNHQLDLLVMVDNSSSMNPLQAKMSTQLPSFLDALKDQSTGQYPDLHVAVVSSSFGGGAWSNVNQCASGSHPGDDQGNFQQGPGGAGAGTCTGLHAGETYLKNGDGTSANPPNFDGKIGDVFQCMALLGDSGCGFESQFESVYYALAKSLKQAGSTDDDNHDSHNGGFLRPTAVLAVVMLTNEDDCSVASNSLLLDPGVNSAMDPTGLGALQSYRCNEFGHLCDWSAGTQVPPPHGYNFNTNQFDLAMGTFRTPTGPGTGGVMLTNCVSEDGHGKTDSMLKDPDGNPDKTMGHLFPTVPDFKNFIMQLKNNPDDVLVAAIAGPVVDDSGNSLYRVFASQNPAANNEMDPVVDHSCVQATTDPGKPEYADPAVRIHAWTDSFGANNGVFYPICANDFSMAMTAIANKIHQKLGASCISTQIAVDPTDSTKHNCQVSQVITDSSGNKTTSPLEECDAQVSNAPCFKLEANSMQCNDPNAKTLFKVCNDSSCMPMTQSSETKDASIACAVE